MNDKIEILRVGGLAISVPTQEQIDRLKTIKTLLCAKSYSSEQYQLYYQAISSLEYSIEALSTARYCFDLHKDDTEKIYDIIRKCNGVISFKEWIVLDYKHICRESAFTKFAQTVCDDANFPDNDDASWETYREQLQYMLGARYPIDLYEAHNELYLEYQRVLEDAKISQQNHDDSFIVSDCDAFEKHITLGAEIRLAKIMISHLSNDLSSVTESREAIRAMAKIHEYFSRLSCELDSLVFKRYYPEKGSALKDIFYGTLKEPCSEIDMAVINESKRIFKELFSDGDINIAESCNATSKPLKGEREVREILASINQNRDRSDCEVREEWLTVTEFKTKHLDILRPYSSEQLGKVLRRLGYDSKFKRISGNLARRYLLPCEIWCGYGSNNVLMFLDACCKPTENGKTACSTAEMWNAFREWCKLTGEYCPKRKDFTKALADKCNIPESKLINASDGKRYYPYTLTDDAREELSKKEEK